MPSAQNSKNIPAVTQSAPGYGAVHSPVVIVGQSLCGPCMASQIPFTGGSGRFLDRSLAVADLAKEDIFITNVVHCHPPANRPSQPHEIANCRPYLHRELAIVARGWSSDWAVMPEQRWKSSIPQHGSCPGRSGVPARPQHPTSRPLRCSRRIHRGLRAKHSQSRNAT